MKKTTLFQIHPLAFYLQFLFVAGTCMPILHLKLKVHYILSWPAIPEYISRKMKPSAIFILYNSAEGFMLYPSTYLKR